MKLREPFRPVAPICIETVAPQIFTPGTPDPYMLFDHFVKEHWAFRIPAVLHDDKTARLQTVSYKQNPVIYDLLLEFHRLTGIPLLCNTSANENGCGFFPDVESAMQWGKCKYIWSEGMLYERE